MRLTVYERVSNLSASGPTQVAYPGGECDRTCINRELLATGFRPDLELALKERLHTQGGPLHTHGGPLHTQGGPLHTQGGPLHTQGGLLHTRGGPSHTRR